MAANRLPGLAERVRIGLVVAGDAPDLAFVLDADLRAAGDMAGGVEGDADAADLASGAVGEALDVDLRAEAVADHRRGGGGGEVVAVAGIGMVGMAMGDERAIDRVPRVDVETAGGAIDAIIGEGKHGRHLGETRRNPSPTGRRSAEAEGAGRS